MFDKGKSGFDQLLDNIRAETIAFVHTKDRASISKQIRIGVVLTPQIEKTFVRIAAPAYTGLKARKNLTPSKASRHWRAVKCVFVCNPTALSSKARSKSRRATNRRNAFP